MEVLYGFLEMSSLANQPTRSFHEAMASLVKYTLTLLGLSFDFPHLFFPRELPALGLQSQYLSFASDPVFLGIWTWTPTSLTEVIWLACIDFKGFNPCYIILNFHSFFWPFNHMLCVSFNLEPEYKPHSFKNYAELFCINIILFLLIISSFEGFRILSLSQISLQMMLCV